MIVATAIVISLASAGCDIASQVRVELNQPTATNTNQGRSVSLDIDRCRVLLEQIAAENEMKCFKETSGRPDVFGDLDPQKYRFESCRGRGLSLTIAFSADDLKVIVFGMWHAPWQGADYARLHDRVIEAIRHEFGDRVKVIDPYWDPDPS
jgi:hypothetical protein